jgi:uncharacterized protein
LLALWAFARSSTRFHSWLYTHPWFGPSLQRWDKYRVIPPLGKLLSIGFMTASFLYMTIYVDLHPLLLALIAVVMLYAAWFILTKPSRVPGQGGAVITD